MVGSIAIAALACFSCSHVSYLSPGKSIIAEKTVTLPASPRKVYRYSIVPGGVYSPEELTRARRVDAVVAAHYADFGRSARVGKLATDMYVYVSYRKADKVFWSTKKHRVCAGESVLTDGTNMARTRCGNRLSVTAQQPTWKGPEPSEPALNGTIDLAGLPSPPLFYPDPSTPLEGSGARTADVAETAPAAASGASPGVAPSSTVFPVTVPPGGAPLLGTGGGPGILPGGTGGNGGGGGAPPPPVVITGSPEPASFFLFAIAAGALGFVGRRRRPYPHRA
jgi:hypothetical protein